MDFWKKLKKNNKNILALAPLAGITDAPFRQICKSYGADVVYSEMASVSALVYKPEKTLSMLRSDKSESPYVIQLFGSDPKQFSIATKLISNQIESQKYSDGYLVPQGIDINFGCPVRKVQKQGAGAVLMNDLKLSREIIKSVLNSTDLPVSIKTRTTAGKHSVLEFLENVNDLPISAAMIHGRSLSQGFSGDIDCEVIKSARNFFGGVILANGGIMNIDDAARIKEQTHADGLGIARGCLGRPWIFEEIKNQQVMEYDFSQIKEIISKQAALVVKYFGQDGIKEFRKHLCWYVQGLPGARQLRQEFIKVDNISDIYKVLKNI